MTSDPSEISDLIYNRKYDPKRKSYPLDMRDFCALEPYVAVVKNKGIVFTDGRTRFYVDGLTYNEYEGFIGFLTEDE